MGVINMAHGEMLMLGAYAAYSVQEFFRAYLPDFIDWYVLAALPVAFTCTAIIGMALERSVIRFLYGRPLDTLLVTWGISMIIIQLVRLSYGASNVSVANPSWLTGGIELLPGQIFPYARLAAIVFAMLIVFLVWYLLNRTSLGLKVRAVQQNRSMAACMGINTVGVDMWTFGLGAGIAGLAGVALSQILLVGPNLGQSLIIESFMVVVTGGVGNIAGTVAGAYGLGVLDKFLEPLVGPAMVKVCLLVFIILFIQWRPEGLFPPKGRVGET
jgi:urea transport system permease protein